MEVGGGEEEAQDVYRKVMEEMGEILDALGGRVPGCYVSLEEQRGLWSYRVTARVEL